MDRRKVGSPSSDREFSEFAAAAHSRLRNTAYLLCGDWERAADHVQEGLIRVYVAWPRLVRRGGELAYARKAVVSAFIDASRRRSSTDGDQVATLQDSDVSDPGQQPARRHAARRPAAALTRNAESAPSDPGRDHLAPTRESAGADSAY